MQGQPGTSLSKAKDGPCTFPYLISTAAADGLDYARHGSLQDVVLVILQGQPHSLGIACELTTQLALVASYMSLVWDHMPEPCLLCIQHQYFILQQGSKVKGQGSTLAYYATRS